MKKTYRIINEPNVITWEKVEKLYNFYRELTTIDGIDVSNDKISFDFESDMENRIIKLAEKYSIVNLIGV